MGSEDKIYTTPRMDLFGGGSFKQMLYFMVLGRKNLPNTAKLQVEDGSETPEALVAFTSQVYAHGETSSVVLVMAVVNVTTGVIQYMHGTYVFRASSTYP